MAVTQNTYTGNGSTVLYSFTFPYLETTDIKVSVNGTVVTTYTFANATTIQFNTAPANGAAIRIYRQTDDSALPATFYSGSAIRSADLNDNFTQNLYVTQESTNNAATATSTANTALSNSSTALSQSNTAIADSATALSQSNTAISNSATALSQSNTAISDSASAVSTANTASTNASNAVTTANTALSTANTASSNASAAVSTANTASSNASAAVSTANAASSNASTALSTANTALSTATTADTNATAALNAVAGTVQYVLVANVAAIPGTPGNGDAIEIADSTGIESFTPLTNLPAGYVGDPGLSVRLQYLSAGSSWNWLNYFANNAETRYLKLAGGTVTGNLAVSGTLTKSGNNVVTVGDTGTVTSTMIANGTIVDADVNASAAIAGTKVSPNFGSQTITTTGVVSAAAGAAATPSITFTGDTNTGIYSPGADQVAVATNGTGRLFVDASGNVGIANTSPSSFNSDGRNLVVGSGSGGQGLTIFSGTSNYGTIYFADGTSGDALYRGAVLYNHASDFMRFDTASAERLRITSAGLVGIGTSSPSAALHVVTSGAGQIRYFDGAVTGAFGSFGSGNEVFLGSGKALAFTTNGITSSETRMTIDTSGRVGIGTTSPSGQLSVTFNGNSVQGIVATDTGTPGAGNYYLLCGSSGGIQNVASNEIHHSAVSALAFRTGSGNGTERARIDSSGRLLVGTSSTAGNGSAVQVIGPNAVEVFRYSAPTGNSGPSISLTRSASNTVGTVAAVAATDDLGQVTFRGAGNGTTFVEGASIRATVESGTISGSSLPTRLVFSVTADGASSPTERMRIGSNGYLKASNTGSYIDASRSIHELVSSTNDWTARIYNSGSVPEGLEIKYTNASPNGIASYFLYCADSTSVRCAVRSNGGIANYSANDSNLSDRNAKKDISPASGTWDCLKQWEIVNYRYKDQPDDADLNLGVIAQQVAESCPEVITVFEEAKDDQPEKLGVKEQQMMWMAIKALQEAQVRIETLEAEVAALKAQ